MGDSKRKFFVCISGEGHGKDLPPVEKKSIRGSTLFQACIAYQTPEGAAVQSIVLADPKGSIPKAAVNSQSKKRPRQWHKALKEAYADLYSQTRVAQSGEWVDT